MANWLNVGLMAAGPTIEAGVDIANGKGVVKSVVKAGTNFAVNDAISGLVGGPAMWAMLGGQLAWEGAKMYGNYARGKGERVGRNITGTGKVGVGFMDTEYAATMRQRGLESIGGHQGLVRNALGSEARRRAYNIRY